MGTLIKFGQAKTVCVNKIVMTQHVKSMLRRRLVEQWILTQPILHKTIFSIHFSLHFMCFEAREVFDQIIFVHCSYCLWRLKLNKDLR